MTDSPHLDHFCDDLPPAVVWYDPDDPLRFAEDGAPVPPRANPRRKTPSPAASAPADAVEIGLAADHPLAASVKRSPDAYLDLADVEKLARATLGFLGARLCAFDTLDVGWVRSIKRRGYAGRRNSPEFGGAYVYLLRFSKIVFSNFPLAERVKVIIHEACHVANAVLEPLKYPQHTREKQGHGPYWQSLMIKCGLPPDRYDKSHRGVDIHAVCPGCAHAHAIRFSTAQGMRLARCHLVCSDCGTVMRGEHLEVPAHHARRLPPPAKHSLFGYVCGKCGTRSTVSGTLVDHLAGDLSSRAYCRGCMAVFQPEHFQQAHLAYCLMQDWWAPAAGLPALQEQGAVFVSTADLRKAAEFLPLGAYWQLPVWVLTDGTVIDCYYGSRSRVTVK